LRPGWCNSTTTGLLYVCTMLKFLFSTAAELFEGAHFLRFRRRHNTYGPLKEQRFLIKYFN
jgi:hypothetical protein